jgi:diguanylate cyclase (GGDEF)-like protein
MIRFFSPRLQVSIGLLSLTVSLIFIASSLGLLPNEGKAEAQARATLSGALAVQLASLASRNEAAAVQETIDSVVDRSPDILSIGIRDAEGRLTASSKDHASTWRDPPAGMSTPTHMQVPLLNGETPAGRIEIAFRPLLDESMVFGLPSKLLVFIGFIAVTGFAGYYFVLARALRELDPGRAVPDRVKAAFDTLAEGVLILDDEERMLMANRAFADKMLENSDPELGRSASDLPWLSPAALPLAPDLLPWRIAIQKGHSVLGTAMGIRDSAGELQRLIVNATCIVDGKGIARGVIATFDDVTALHRTNEELKSSIRQLHLSQAKISEQNEQLTQLASSDPLTGCLNRRTFFDQAERLLSVALAAGQQLSFIMIDADHFKAVNDKFGHLAGDRVLVGLATLLKDCCKPPHLLGRYGGEEFCVVLVGAGEVEVEYWAERVRTAIAGVRSWLPGGGRMTVSIGIAALGRQPCALADLVKRADDALYAAKSRGRNRFVNWKNLPKKSPARDVAPDVDAESPLTGH